MKEHGLKPLNTLRIPSLLDWFSMVLTCVLLIAPNPGQQPYHSQGTGLLTQAQCDSGANYWGTVLSPDGTRVATVKNLEEIRLWDTQNSSSIQTIPVSSEVYTLTFSPDATILAVGLQDKALVIDVATGTSKFILDQRSTEIDPQGLSVQFTTNGNLLITGSREGAIVWDLMTGTEKYRFRGHMAYNNGRFNVSIGGNFLTTLDEDGYMLWNVLTGQLVHKFYTRFWNNMGLSPDGKTFLRNDRWQLAVWSTGTFTRHFYLDMHVAERSWIFSPDSRYVMVFSTDYGPTRDSKLWDVQTGTLLHTFALEPIDMAFTAFFPNSRLLYLPSDERFNPSGNFIVMQIWNVIQNKEEKKIILDQTAQGETSAFTNDGMRWLVGNLEGNLALRDPNTGAKIREFC